MSSSTLPPLPYVRFPYEECWHWMSISALPGVFSMLFLSYMYAFRKPIRSSHGSVRHSCLAAVALPQGLDETTNKSIARIWEVFRPHPKAMLEQRVEMYGWWYDLSCVIFSWYGCVGNLLFGRLAVYKECHYSVLTWHCCILLCICLCISLEVADVLRLQTNLKTKTTVLINV